MKSKKQIAILMAALCMIAPLSACGGDSATESSSSEATEAATTQPEATTEQPTTAEPATEAPTEAEQATEAPEAEAEPTESVDAAAAIAEAVQNGDYSLVDPDFKAMMDEYEAFYTDYIDFMNTYNESDDVSSLMSAYLDWMGRLTTWTEKIDAIDVDNLSPADDAYYVLVTLRIAKKVGEIETTT